MRLDEYLHKTGMFDSRTKAKQAVERGEIFLNGVCANKCSAEIDENNPPKTEKRCASEFVSLGGYKLNKALDDFAFDVAGMAVADVGASTGGFTDCLLKRGAKKVFAVDLNDALLHPSLKKDGRVKEIIKSAKDLTREDFPEEPNLLVADLSFISLTLVMDVFSLLLSGGKYMILLIKPQFETGGKHNFKNGIIREESYLIKAKKDVRACAEDNGFIFLKDTSAPVSERKNHEFLALFVKADGEK